MRSQDAIAQEITSLRAKVKDLEATLTARLSPEDHLKKVHAIEKNEALILALMWVTEAETVPNLPIYPFTE